LELERVLTKLKYDDAVSGYALITNDGQPFLSFGLPEEVLPQIQGTLRIHSTSFKLVNVMTGEGIVVLARIDDNWVLAVLFTAELNLGEALQRTKSVVDLMDEVILPPPPQLVEEITPPSEPVPEPQEEVVEDTPVPEVETPAIKEPAVIDEPSTAVTEAPTEIRHGCVVLRADNYSEAMSLDTELNASLKKQFSNLGVDVLLMADEKRTVFKIAESLAKPVEQIIDVVIWCVDQNIVGAECPEEQESGTVEIIELPIFEGELKKAKKDHQPVLELCDGNRTLQEIAQELEMPYFKALQSTVPYRGKTLRFVRKSKRAEK
jgi:hypothetical protein